MDWDPEILARLRNSREEAVVPRKQVVRRKERNISARAPGQTNVPEIKMVVGDWHTDELGNRSRMIYNAKTIEPVAD